MKKLILILILAFVPSFSYAEITLYPNVDVFVDESFWSTFPAVGSPYYTFIDGDTTAAEDFDYAEVDCNGDTVSFAVLEVKINPRLLPPPRKTRGLSRGFIDLYIRCKSISGDPVALSSAYYPDTGGSRPPLFLMPDVSCPTSGFSTFKLDTDAINAHWGSSVVRSPAIIYMGIQCTTGTEKARISAMKMVIKNVKRYILGTD